MAVRVSAPVSCQGMRTHGADFKGVRRGATPQQSIVRIDDIDFVKMPSPSRLKAPSHRTNAWSNLPMLDEARLVHYGTKVLPKSTTLLPSLLISGGKMKTTSQVIAQVKESRNLAFIPLVLESSYSFLSPTLPKSLIPRHVVLIIVDKKNETVEYFDSKGKDPMKKHGPFQIMKARFPPLLELSKKLQETLNKRQSGIR